MVKRYTVDLVETAKTDGSRRRITNVPPLNDGDVVDVGKRVTILTEQPQLEQQIGQPLSLSSGSMFIQSTTPTSIVRPVEIMAISNQGTSGALVTVQECNNEGVVTPSGTTFVNVVPRPFRHMATIGMRGMYYSASVPSGMSGTRVTVSFVELPIHGFGLFG
jgi:hypothetical protein